MHQLNTDDFLFTLAHCPFLSHREKWLYLIDIYPQFKSYTSLNERRIPLTFVKKQQIHRFFDAFNAAVVKDRYRKIDLHTVPLGSPDYPYALKNSYEPPVLLFYKGEYSLLDQSLLGIVGARECTEYGDQVLDHLIPSIVSHGLVTVSGLARGIDRAVHSKTIENGGKTVAVIGNGIGYFYPKENKALQEEISKNHLVISEYPFTASPKKQHFPLRNRIIAGLSRGVVVVEAKERSGSLITARLALDEGRDVFAVPGSVFSEQSRGCLDLIKSGAIPCVSAEDILSEWHMSL